MIAYVNILLPLPLSQPIFTYKMECEDGFPWSTLVGKLAEVPLGKGKTYTGLILSISESPFSEKPIRYKRVTLLLPYPHIPAHIIKLWQWASEYYMCSLGEIFSAAVPSAIRPDGKQDKELSKPARTIKGWVPSKKFINSESWQASLFVEMKGKPAVTKAMTILAQDYKPESQIPMTLNELSAWLGVSQGVIKQLREHRIIEEVIVRIADVEIQHKIEVDVDDPISNKIRFGSHNILLLQIENSSTLDRIPFEFIKKKLEDQQQILLLLPTLEQLREVETSLRSFFFEAVLPYHSESSTKEKEETWLAALEGKSGIFLGLRAAAWLPFSRLGQIIIIDEEDRGYRQYEPAPRFTATNLALMLNYYCKSKCVLVSSTPSIEIYMQALQKKYAYLSIPKARKTIDIQTVNMPRSFEKQRVQGRMLSFELIGAIRETIEEQGIILLMYQRRGFAKRATCKACEESPKCPKCHTIYRYFQESNKLVCGMCGHHETLPKVCPNCHKPALELEGTGIERIKSSLQKLYPGTTVEMDEKVSPSKGLPQIILSSSYEPPHSLLQKASCIGILQLDLLTTFSDFRANENAYHFLTKCRDEAPLLKRMVVQYFVENQNALIAFTENDYQVMLDHELEERHTVLFPPFSRHIDIYFESSAQIAAYRLAEHAQKVLSQQLNDCSIMGPAPMPIHKRDKEIGYKLTLLSPLTRSTVQLRSELTRIINTIRTNYRGPQLDIYFDVDPI